jgi:enamine deaminase RidA (YjgF/YER057c/UK114 family)
MPRIIDPPEAKALSKYATAIAHKASGERLVISGQLGTTPDGKVMDGLEAQMTQAFTNVFAVLKAAGFDKRHLVKLTTFTTMPVQVDIFRKVRDRMLDGQLVATTYLVVAGLAAPQFLVEIEGEAVKE